jgi:hypothetical protein
MTLPEDIIKNVTRENWEELFGEYMIINYITFKGEQSEYVWEPCVMRDFIKALLK